MGYSENLVIIRDQISANLVAMTENPKPSYTIGDETYNWGELFELYTRQLEKYNQLIAAGEPFEFRTKRIVRTGNW